MAGLQAALNDMGTLYRNRRELSAAASAGDTQRVFSILESTGMDVNLVSPQLHSRLGFHQFPPPLLAACETGHLELVRALLSRCKDIQVNVQLNGETPLSAAAKNGHVEIMKLLFDHGASLGDGLTTISPLVCAVQNGKYEAAKLLLQKGANPNGPPFGLTSHPPLTIAASNGHLNLVKLLLDNGANTEQNVIPSALTYACAGGHVQCAQLLIERGANLNAKSNIMGTPLTCAIADRHIECTKLLLAKGANVNEPVEMNKTPLMMASEKGYIDEVKLLLKYGANVAAVGSTFTALYLACRENHLTVAEMLIQNGASVNQIPDKAHEILLQVIRTKYTDIACLLIHNGVRINGANVFGETPLVCAIQNNNLRIVKELVQHGASVDFDSHSLSSVTKVCDPAILSFLQDEVQSQHIC